MNSQFNQPNKVVSVEVDKQSIARNYGVKHSEVTYAKPGQLLDGYKVIFDKVSQRSYSLPTGVDAGSTLVSLINGVLITSNETFDLGKLAVIREEFVKLQPTFLSGFTLAVPNEIVTDGNSWYRWGGTFPKVVGASSTPNATGGINPDNWIDVGSTSLRTDLKSGADDKGDSLVTVKQPFAGAIARSQHSKNIEIVSVKDFGAVGDGDADDTVAIQAAITSLYPAGGRLYFPKGSYKISAQLNVKNIPIEIFGDGMYTSRIEQVTADANGISFVSDTVNNAPTTDNLLINVLHIHDISINRGLNKGGVALAASWGIMTSNSPQCIMERFRVYSKSDAGRTWAGGVDLRNCNGLRISTVQIHGNPLETPLTAADPYTLRYGIRLSNDSSNALGLISFFIDKLTVIAAGVGINVFGWHEGFEVVNCELVQVGIGIQVTGDVSHQNPDFFYLNSHIEARIKCVTMSNVFKPKFIGCDLFQSSAVGYTGAVIELNGCQGVSVTGTTLSMQRGSSTYTVAGIVSDTSYHGNVSGCTFLGLDSGIDIQRDSWNITGNVFYQVINPIRLYGNFHTLGSNKYTECTNKVLYSGTGHQVTPISFIASQVMNVSAAGSTQGFTVQIPTGIFKTTPDMVVITPIGGSTPTMLSCTYNFALSTATLLKIEVTASQSLGVGQYNFGIHAMSRQ